MTPQELKARTKRFALLVIRLYRTLRHSEGGLVIGRQLFRGGTSVGANYRAVCRARSDAEFASKLGTVIEEADETSFWLEILVEADIVPASAATPLIKEADELTRIFVASRETARRRMRTQNPQSRIKDQESIIENP